MLTSALVVLLLIVGCSGCSRLVSANEAKIEHVKGTWSGALTPIRLYDHADTPYDGLALKTETGPALPTPVPDSKGGGSLPVLVTNTLSGRILDPTSLPMGKPARVTGVMSLNHACVREEQEVSGPHSLLRSNDGTVHHRWEHIIMITRDPTILRE